MPMMGKDGDEEEKKTSDRRRYQDAVPRKESNACPERIPVTRKIHFPDLSYFLIIP